MDLPKQSIEGGDTAQQFEIEEWLNNINYTSFSQKDVYMNSRRFNGSA